MGKSDLRKQLEQCHYASESDEFDSIVSDHRIGIGGTKTLTHLPLELLDEYADENLERQTGRPQPFHAYTDQALEQLAHSIREHGVIDPITVRPCENGRYQILAGRNRARASRLCGNKEIPAIIRDKISDTDAVLIMLDTNLEQRHNLSYSEKAYAYKMRADLLNRRGKRTDLHQGQDKVDTLGQIGQECKESRRTVAYLIRLTYLIPELLNLLDQGRLGFKIGVELSYFTSQTQTWIYRCITDGIKPRSTQLKELRAMDSEGVLTQEQVKQIICGTTPNKAVSFTIKSTRLNEYADLFHSTDELEHLFFEFLESRKRQPSAKNAQS